MLVYIGLFCSWFGQFFGQPNLDGLASPTSKGLAIHARNATGISNFSDRDQAMYRCHPVARGSLLTCDMDI